MHISEGVLPAATLIAGAALAVGGISLGLRKMEQERLPQVALLAAAFFVASLVNLPAGPARVHLVLNGLLGLLLGWSAFPAIFVALALQALLFSFGGLTTLGISTFNMAFPALLAHWICGPWARGANNHLALAAGFAAGFLGVALSAILVALSLLTAGEDLLGAAQLILAAHLPVMLVEGLVTAAAVVFLRRVRPAMLAWDR
ncbi:MAG: cobalt transporter CbiM [Desulfarculus sp.]|nr:cobalt transporter CbiM [Desulfarculus sp.]